jgi:nucleoside-diphosphate-sugar epimerase
MKKIVLITGHLGFIGSNLKSHLEKLNYTVLGVDLKSSQDILTCNFPECDVVIHLAGIGGVRESVDDPAKYWINNVEGTKRVLNFYKNIRVIVAGSSSQYEPHLNPYAATKHIIEKIPHQQACFMRLHTVYSSTPRANMFFDKLINGTLTYVTDHERDFIHIDDVCDAITLLINSNIVGPIDVGTGVSIKIKDIRPDLPINHNTTLERKKTLADTSLMKSLGFSPKHSVTEFLKTLKK